MKHTYKLNQSVFYKGQAWMLVGIRIDSNRVDRQFELLNRDTNTYALVEEHKVRPLAADLFPVGIEVASVLGSGKFVVRGYEPANNSVVCASINRAKHDRTRYSYGVDDLELLEKESEHTMDPIILALKPNEYCLVTFADRTQELLRTRYQSCAYGKRKIEFIPGAFVGKYNAKDLCKGREGLILPELLTAKDLADHNIVALHKIVWQ